MIIAAVINQMMKSCCGGKQYDFVNHLMLVNPLIFMFMLNILQLIIVCSYKCLTLDVSH